MRNILIILAFTLAIFACNSKKTAKNEGTDIAPDTVAVALHVEGMTCDHCEMTVQGSVTELAGIIDIKADHEDSTTTVKFDASQTSLNEITKAIEKKGYRVTNKN